MPYNKKKDYINENTGAKLDDGVHSGFPSPAQDYLDGILSLDKELVSHPAATYYMRIADNFLEDAGINVGDVLIVDRALDASEGDMVVGFVDGEFVLRKISFHAVNDAPVKVAKKPKISYNILKNRDIWLYPILNEAKPVHIVEGNDFSVWGVVTYIIKRMR